MFSFGLICDNRPSFSRGNTAMNPLLQRIRIDPNICFGKTCIRGTRIWVSLILDQLAAGATFEDVVSNYPHLTREDLLAAIAYGAEAARERVIPIPIETNA
jgi:uncharacterized protein (DUF433 family)